MRRCAKGGDADNCITVSTRGYDVENLPDLRDYGYGMRRELVEELGEYDSFDAAIAAIEALGERLPVGA